MSALDLSSRAPSACGVRLANAADAGPIARIYAPYVSETAISFELDPPDAAEIGRRITNVLAVFPWLVWEDEGGVAGYAYGARHRDRAAYQWSADVAVYVAPGAHRKGIGTALYTALLRQMAFQGVHTLYAGVTLPNEASVRLHEAMGFRPIGVYREVGHKLGAWHDVGWWGLPLGPASDCPTPPRTFDAEAFAVAPHQFPVATRMDPYDMARRRVVAGDVDGSP